MSDEDQPEIPLYAQDLRVRLVTTQPIVLTPELAEAIASAVWQQLPVVHADDGDVFVEPENAVS